MDSNLAQNIPKGIERTNITGEGLVNSQKYTSNKNTLNFGKPSAVKKVVLAARDNRKQKNISLLLNYLTVLWRWIVSFFNGLKDRKVTKDVFSTPLPPTCSGRIVPNKSKVPVLKGIPASKMLNYPLRRLCPLIKHDEANDIRSDWQENREESEVADPRIHTETSTFRYAAMQNFEQTFKVMSQTRSQSLGNMIDWCSHKKWLNFAEISEDSNAEIFKNFAGGKLLLNLPDYKDLIQLICKQNNLNYWNVVYKMGCIKHH